MDPLRALRKEVERLIDDAKPSSQWAGFCFRLTEDLCRVDAYDQDWWRSAIKALSVTIYVLTHFIQLTKLIPHFSCWHCKLADEMTTKRQNNIIKQIRKEANPRMNTCRALSSKLRQHGDCRNLRDAIQRVWNSTSASAAFPSFFFSNSCSSCQVPRVSCSFAPEMACSAWRVLTLRQRLKEWMS